MFYVAYIAENDEKNGLAQFQVLYHIIVRNILHLVRSYLMKQDGGNLLIPIRRQNIFSICVSCFILLNFQVKSFCFTNVLHIAKFKNYLHLTINKFCCRRTRVFKTPTTASG